MRIRELSLHLVGPFENATLDFGEHDGEGELVLFEGPNGCGKTTIAEVLAVVAASQPTRSNDPRPTLPGQRRGMSWRVLPREGPGAPTVRLRKRVRADGSAGVRLTHLSGSFSIERLGGHDGSAAEGPSPEILECLSPKALRKWAAFAYHSQMATPVLATPGPKDVRSDPLAGALSFEANGRGDLSLGQFLSNSESRRTKAIVYAQDATLPAEGRTQLDERAASELRMRKRMERAFSLLLSRRVEIRFQFAQEAAVLHFDGEPVPVDLLGEGMRSTLAWIADLVVRLERVGWADQTRSPFEQEFWLILDEVEASLHPTAQLRVLPALRELFPRAHIYATTHSPFVVASAGEGRIFRLRPDPSTHLVSGTLEPVQLAPGQSLEWVIASIFNTPTGIVDTDTRAAIEAHQRDIRALRGGAEVDWPRLLERRGRLLALNEEVATIVLVTEAPVRKRVEEKLRGEAA